MRRLWIFLLLVVVAAGAGARAQSYYLVPDVATDLAGTTYLPWDVVRNDAGVYSLPTSLPPFTPVDALHRMGTGDFLVSVEATTELGGVDWDRRDVFVFTTLGTFGPFPPYGGALGLIPTGSNVDAVFLEPVSGDIIVSFDTPTTIGPATFDAADLVRYAGGAFVPVPFFDASSFGIPPSVNVIAADVRLGLLYLSFDVPATIGALTFLPGEIVQFDSGLAMFTVYDPQPAWPSLRSSRVNAFSFLADPGMTTGLTVTLFSPTQVLLTWTGASCAGGEDWGVFEGTIGTWYSHAAVVCTTGGATSQLVTFGAGNRYYLVVPNNPMDEGSEGIKRIGGVPMDRSGPPICRPSRVLDCSP